MSPKRPVTNSHFPSQRQDGIQYSIHLGESELFFPVFAPQRDSDREASWMDGWILFRPEALSLKGLGALTTVDNSRD